MGVIYMSLAQLRYQLAGTSEMCRHPDDRLSLLIDSLVYEHSSRLSAIKLLERLKEDLELMPEIAPTSDGTEIKFYERGYNEEVFGKSELLAFIFASLNPDWDIVEGIDLFTGQKHFWLKSENVIFDASLSVVATKLLYFKSNRFKQLKEIKNKDVGDYLKENNNLYKFYSGCTLEDSEGEDNPDFSVNFINGVLEKFNKNVETYYIPDEKKIEHIKRYFNRDDFIDLRQALTGKRKSFLRGSVIAVHSSLDTSILESIDRTSKRVCKLMKREYNIDMDYYRDTLNNCHGLSIMFNLFDGSFKLVQGGIPYQKEDGTVSNRFFQHSWLEKGDIVYDPALRVVTPKDLYYVFVQKQDEYTREETQDILKRIGFNLTHFRDFMSGVQIGNDETFRYRCLVNKIDSPEMREEGEKLIRLVEVHNQ